MRQLAYNDTLRVSGHAQGDGAGMGDAVPLSTLFGLGAGLSPALGTLEQQELPGLRLTHLVLDNFIVNVVSTTTSIGVGGELIYTFPLGYIQRYACRALLDFAIDADHQADFTDGTPEGDVGIGSVAPANTDALGTDATDDDWGTGASVVFSAYAKTGIAVAPEAAAVVDGHTTAAKLYLNMDIDAADIDDGTATEILVSGDIWVLWAQQGGA